MKGLLLVLLLAVAAASAAVIENNIPEGAEIVPEGAQEMRPTEVVELTSDDDDNEFEDNSIFSFLRASSSLVLGNFNNANRQVVWEIVTRQAVQGHSYNTQVRYNGDFNARFGYIRVREWGDSQGATVALVDGGINTNFAIFRMRSQRGRGFSFLVEIWRL